MLSLGDVDSMKTIAVCVCLFIPLSVWVSLPVKMCGCVLVWVLTQVNACVCMHFYTCMYVSVLYEFVCAGRRVCVCRIVM